MKTRERRVRHTVLLDNRKGSALIAALLLVAVSGIMGATILFATSTDLQISGNYRRAIQSFYAAEAGLAETQRRLSGLPVSNPLFLGDLEFPNQPNWSAYVFSQTGWKPTDDQTYNPLLTNYVPLSGNSTNTLAQPNSVQSDVPYWTKVHHKTEYDAEQAGHRLATPHYWDGDGVTTLHTSSNRGQLLRFGYPLATSVKPEQFTTILPTWYAPVEVIMSHGEIEGADSILRADVIHPAGPPVWAPIYAGNEVVLSGNMITIQGMDACGMLSAGLPPIAVAPLASLVGTAGLTGNPAIPQISPKALDLNGQIKGLKKGATPVLAHLFSVTLGSASSPAVHYAEPSSGTLTVSQVTGYGILLVKGNVQIASPFLWEGLVVVSGQVTFTGGLGSSTLNGALYADRVHVLNDNVSFVLDTCPMAATLRMLPVQVLTWRQLL
jgi:type IV pilus assembly PilX-like protein